MKSKITVVLSLILCFGLITTYIQPVEVLAATHHQTKKRKKKRERNIWQKNSQRKKSFVCRDGAISHSKSRRGACSGHRGVLRSL